MKKHSGLLSIISIILSTVSCILCIITLSLVLRLQTANPATQTDSESSVRPEQTEEVQHDIITLRPENGTDWHFEFPLRNDTDEQLSLTALFIRDYVGGTGGEMTNEYVFDEMRLREINVPLTLGPGEENYWDDWHPVVDFFDSRTYTFVYHSESSKEISVTYAFELSHEGAVGDIDYSGDEGQDLFTLRYGADFEAEVAPGVYWVPARDLGDSSYTNAQITGMLSLSPSQKQEQIDTLYEAMQLYQIGNFFSSDDNIRIEENGVHWEHHKPGEHAVRTNNGCCATSANWLNYILRDDYDEVGFVSTSQRDGNGHIFNYILQDGWYYIIDMTHYRTDWIATAVESGDLDDYYSSDFIPGNIHKVRDIQQYVDYVQQNYGDPPGLMFMYTAADCLALDSRREQNGVTIIYEDAENVDVRTIFDDPQDNLTVTTAEQPVQRPDWSRQ